MERVGLISIGFLLTALLIVSGQRQCPRLQKPWNGDYIGSCDRQAGAQCVFQCIEPYILVGSQVRTCRPDGTWSGRTTACELDGCANCGGGGSSSNCANLYNPDNGYTEGQCTPGIVGQTCVIRCNSGYALQGQSRLTCLAGGRWSANMPACRLTSAAICEDIVIQNGYASCSQQGGLTVCSVVCDESYMIVGSSVVTCSPSGDWSDQIPSCRSSFPETANICPTLNAPNGGRLVGSCTSANTGDTCQLVCLSGYRPTDTRVLVCQTNGVWSNSLPRCISDGGGGGGGCPSISVSQATLTSSCVSSSTGDFCTITCNSGYTLTGGSGTLICQSNGQWSGSIPTCTGLTCPALAPPPSGRTSGTCSPGQSGQSCSFFCDSGYTLVGQSTLVCGSDGRWSGNPPYCTGSACPSLYPPAFGSISGSCTRATVGQVCTFSCQSGYTLTGQSTLYCQSGGTWTSPAPYCTRGTGEQGSNCPELTPPPNGYFESCNSSPGGQCIVVCERGYARSGSRVRTCLTNGFWSGYAPTCTRTVGYTYRYKVVPLWSLVFG